jgi:hypothetical protein
MAFAASLGRHVMKGALGFAALSCGGLARNSVDDVGAGGTRATSHASGGNAHASGGNAHAAAGGTAPEGLGGFAPIPPPPPDPPVACAAIAYRFSLDALDGGMGCGGKLPALAQDQPLDPRLVNLSYTDGNTRQILVYVGTEDACGTEFGWYYDDATNPTEVFGCPRTCDFARSPSGYVAFDLQVGCPVKIPP